MRKNTVTFFFKSKDNGNILIRGWYKGSISLTRQKDRKVKINGKLWVEGCIKVFYNPLYISMVWLHVEGGWYNGSTRGQDA